MNTAAEDTQVVEVLTPTTVQLLQSAEIDQQIATARKYPRSVTRFIRQSTELATINPETAIACNYALPRGGKLIEGPSVRLAEIVASQWGNCRYGARIVAEDSDFVTAQGVFHDLENNSFVTFEVKRRIVDKYGKRYNADMIGVTSNAACSIALRNAVFKGVPKAIWDSIYRESRMVAAGSIETLAARRANALAEFAKLDVKPAEIYAVLGIDGKADIGLDEMLTLGGLLTAIRDGDTTVEQVFKSPASTVSATSGIAAAKRMLIKDDEAPPADVDPDTGEVELNPAIPTYDAETAEKLLRSKRTLKTLAEAWTDIRSDFQATARELPLAVEAAYDEMAEALAEKEED